MIKGYFGFLQRAPTWNGVYVAALLFACIGLIVGAFLVWQIDPGGSLGPAVATLAAAFLGPYFAFGLESQRRQAEKRAEADRARAERARELIKAAYLFSRYLNSLLPLVRDIEKLGAFKTVCFQLKASLPVDLRGTSPDWESLSFIGLENGEFLTSLYLIEEGYTQAIVSVHQRAEVYVNDFQAAFHQLRPESRAVCTPYTATFFFSSWVLDRLYMSTGVMQFHVYSTVLDIMEAIESLAEHGRRFYPGEPVASFKLPDDPEFDREKMKARVEDLGKHFNF